MQNEEQNLNEVQTGNSIKSDVSISKNQLLKTLYREWYFKYHLYPEGESQEDYPKRCLRGEGFLNAMKVIADFY